MCRELQINEYLELRWGGGTEPVVKKYTVAFICLSVYIPILYKRLLKYCNYFTKHYIMMMLMNL